MFLGNAYIIFKNSTTNCEYLHKISLYPYSALWVNDIDQAQVFSGPNAILYYRNVEQTEVNEEVQLLKLSEGIN